MLMRLCRDDNLQELASWEQEDQTEQQTVLLVRNYSNAGIETVVTMNCPDGIERILSSRDGRRTGERIMSFEHDGFVHEGSVEISIRSYK
jgi:hypothetical protein